MARRTAQSFAKRQKEMARKLKQQDKAQKRAERRQVRASLPAGAGPEVAWDEASTGLDGDLMPTVSETPDAETDESPAV